jgi:origin recognition complex subunit 2
MKRKAQDSPSIDQQLPLSTPKKQKPNKPPATAITPSHNSTSQSLTKGNGANGLELTPSKRPRATPKKTTTSTPSDGLPLNPSGLKTPTHKSKAKSLFTTPQSSTKAGSLGNAAATPSRTKNADRSAKKKSARVLFEQDEEDIWDGADRLAAEILEDEEDTKGETNGLIETVENGEQNDGATPAPSATDAATPKRRAGRPKGARNKRSPTPDGELPPHERYFFQNRAGPPQTSNNSLARLSLLTHEEYFDKLAKHEDPLREQKELLISLHKRSSFPQWDFELSEDFNICLYGYGSKRRLVQQYAEWLYQNTSPSPTIVIVNGYTPNLSIRTIFATIVTAILGPEKTPSKLGSQPTEVLEFIQSTLQSRSQERSHADTGKQQKQQDKQSAVTILINSIDAPTLRRATNQALLARLAATPGIRLVATSDTPNVSLLWDISLRDQFNFIFHDCTTFAPYDTEWNPVDEVHALLGRKGRRIGGKDGVGFVLKSLPENARNLYRVLLTELLTSIDNGGMEELGGNGYDDYGDELYPDNNMANAGGTDKNAEPGIDFRTLYQKAAEEFIASSEMMFRTLLKEFHDHQMITSRMDASGTETLGVPLSREEMEGVLEDLVLG